MRSKSQLHSSVTYLFAGSNQSIVENIFVKQSGPFYRFAELLPVGALDRSKFYSSIKTKFSSIGIDVSGSAINLLLEITNGHPYYTQLVCREMYFLALAGETAIDKDIVTRAVDEAVLIETPYFTKLWDGIRGNSAQVTIIEDIVGAGRSLYSMRNKKINVSRTLHQLVTKYILVRGETGEYRFVDPLLPLFLERMLR